MKILILGGTGAMGIHLIELLSKNDNQIYITSRVQRKSVGKTQYIQGNAQDFEFLKSILVDQWDAIIDFMVYNTKSFNERISILLKSTSQYIFISSSRVYANANHPLKETSPRLIEENHDKNYLNSDEYALTKARQEDMLKESGYSNWTIIRPYITYSQNRLQLGVLEKEDWLYRAIKRRTIVFSRDISLKLTTMTSGLDVAKGIYSIIGNSKALTETFHITVKNSITWNDVLNIYLSVLEKRLGFKPKVLLQNLDTFFEHHPQKYQVIFDRIYDREFDNSKIAHYVDVNDFSSIEEGISDCLDKFLEQPFFKHIDWKKEALKDRKTKEHTSLNEIDGVKNKCRYLYYRYVKR